MKGTRIPEDFTVTDAMKEWAAENVPGIDLDFATAEFVDYWRSATRNALKLDWVATWRNRMREAYVRAGSPPKGIRPRDGGPGNRLSFQPLFDDEGGKKKP